MDFCASNPMNRLYFYVAIAFVTSFGAVSWAARGFPMHWSGPVSISALQPTITSTFGDQSAEDYERKKPESGNTAQSDTNPSLDKIRREALQAATGFEVSPCDSTMKKNLIEALTAYTRAWQTKLDCPVKMLCSDEKLNAAAEAFSTPLDLRVREALERAFRQPGIAKADFPAAVRFDMLQFAGPGLWAGDESSVCVPQMRSTARGAR
jgi:hypothetical protein